MWVQVCIQVWVYECLNTWEHIELKRCVLINGLLGTRTLGRAGYGVLPRDLGTEGPHTSPEHPKVTPTARSQR